MIELNEPGEFIAAVPGLLGFTPVESFVIVTFTGNAQGRMHCAMRIDLPQDDHTTKVIADLRNVLDGQSLSGAVAVVVGGSDRGASGAHQTNGVPDPPLQGFVTEFQRMATSLGISAAHTLWVDRIEHGQPWRRYGDADYFGTVPDPRASLVAVANVAAGQITYVSREELAGQVAADPETDLDRRAALLQQTAPTSTAEAVAVVRDAVDQIDAGGPITELLEDDRIVPLVQALNDLAVRDAAVRFPLSDQAAAAEQLWSLLTRAAPRPEVTHPATLLAISSALRGDGALANIAIDIALAADPGNRLADLLRAVLADGIPPTSFDRSSARASCPDQSPLVLADLGRSVIAARCLTAANLSSRGRTCGWTEPAAARGDGCTHRLRPRPFSVRFGRSRFVCAGGARREPPNSCYWFENLVSPADHPDGPRGGVASRRSAGLGCVPTRRGCLV